MLTNGLAEPDQNYPCMLAVGRDCTYLFHSTYMLTIYSKYRVSKICNFRCKGDSRRFGNFNVLEKFCTSTFNNVGTLVSIETLVTSIKESF